nr:pyrin-like [Pelodiscus sinensis]|eukprot:XP_025039417.1 pyrin-like [Pelodiscus sinensis]
MAKALRDHLFDTVRELGESDLVTFRDKLNHFQPKAGYSRIKWGELEKAGAVELTRLLINYYRESYAVDVVVSVLKAMDKQDLARSLHQATGLGEEMDLR